MEFQIQGVQLKLQGITAPELVSNAWQIRLCKKEQRGVVLQLLENVTVSGSVENVQLEALLQHFPDVFEEPKGLPPIQAHDHGILVKEGTPLVSVRPYRYAYFQKNEIEKIIKELLGSGVIRPS